MTEQIDHPVLMTECICNPISSRGKMAELLFETYGIPSLAFGVDAVFNYKYRPCAGLAPSRAKRDIFSNKQTPSPPTRHQRTNALPLLSSRSRRSLPLSPARAVSVDSDRLDSPPIPEQEEGNLRRKYYFLVANAKFMLDEEEHFQELMFEKLRNYEERDKELDFWLLIEPKFLDNFPNVTRRLRRPAVALISTDANWITFMKLRLDRVLAESFEADNFAEAMACNPVELHFEKPEKWVAPYPKYESGWWEPFLPKASIKTGA